MKDSFIYWTKNKKKKKETHTVVFSPFYRSRIKFSVAQSSTSLCPKINFIWSKSESVISLEVSEGFFLSSVEYRVKIVEYRVNFVEYRVNLVEYRVKLVEYRVNFIEYRVNLVEYQVNFVEYQVKLVEYRVKLLSIELKLSSIELTWSSIELKLSSLGEHSGPCASCIFMRKTFV